MFFLPARINYTILKQVLLIKEKGTIKECTQNHYLQKGSKEKEKGWYEDKKEKLQKYLEINIEDTQLTYAM